MLKKLQNLNVLLNNYFIPFTFYFCKKSYSAFDEGFYEMQDRGDRFIDGLKLLKVCLIHMIYDV